MAVTVKGAGAAIAIGLAVVASGCISTRMPGPERRSGALPPATADETAAAGALRRHVEKLAAEIGERRVGHARGAGLDAAAAYIAGELRAAGYFVGEQPFEASGVAVRNLDAELRGTRDAGSVFVVGAHYDSAIGTPGADDNASGVATALLLARRLAGQAQGQTIRFAFWVNEEQPFFQTDAMGSARYARRCKERGERIAGALSLETLGYYTDAPGTQRYPSAIEGDYPDRGNFVVFVSDRSSRAFLERVVAAFRGASAFPAEGLAAPGWVEGVGWSDHWAFWQQGYPGVMVTDTAPFRYPHYHRRSDTPDKVVYDRLARVALGLERTLRALAR